MKTSYLLALIAGILIVVNVLANKFFIRLDFTADKNYTLSQATKDLLNNLKEPVTVRAYLTENLSPEVSKLERDFKDMLVEYANRSHGNVMYEFINPSESDLMKAQAQQAGVQPIVVEVREKDQQKQQEAYLGAVIQIGDQKEILSLAKVGNAMEYALSSSIKKLTVKDKPVIALLQGQGEPSKMNLLQAIEALNVLYNVDDISLNDSVSVLDKYKTAAIIAPKDTFTNSQLAQLDQFLARGGNLYIALNHVSTDFEKGMGNVSQTGIDQWLAAKGLVVEDGFILDARCGKVGVRRESNGVPFNVPVEFPYLPIVTNFAKHPITSGLEAMSLQFANPINYKGDKSKTFTPLVKTSEKSGIQPSPIMFDLERKWTENDFLMSHLTVAGVLEGKFNSDKTAKIVLISDGDFAVSEGKNQRIEADNVNFMVNAMDWLADDSGLIQLRSKGVTARPIDEIKDASKSFLKYFNFLFPLILVVLYGLFRMNAAKKKRAKRMMAGQL